ncbi:unnamed protein product [Brassica napus]|uniref:(rape) hypothetical protein n=1 Tax=Brassica napus TaxID=3708 RepID=A0A816IT19_BRANA|nr:unnamed protein product [Brassica napus]
MTKMLNQNSSLIHQAISSLTNISYIHHTHYQFTYLNPLPSSPIPPLGDSSSPHQAAKHITDPTNLACRDHDARSDLRIINRKIILQTNSIESNIRSSYDRLSYQLFNRSSEISAAKIRLLDRESNRSY